MKVPLVQRTVAAGLPNGQDKTSGGRDAALTILGTLAIAFGGAHGRQRPETINGNLCALPRGARDERFAIVVKHQAKAQKGPGLAGLCRGDTHPKC